MDIDFADADALMCHTPEHDWEKTMYKNILIATDGSKFAGQAVSHGLKLAKHIGSKVSFVTVSETWSALDMAYTARGGAFNPVSEYEQAVEKTAGKLLASAKAAAEKAGIASTGVHLKDRHPADGIVEAAAAKKCDLIVMGSHGRRGVQKILLGSIASEVLSLSKLPVLVVKAK